MSVRQQNSSRDRRVSKLSKESNRLRREISELEDALVLHSRYQQEDETSIRGMIRKEVGGPRWEHGGEGKLHTYRGNNDLTEISARDKRRPGKDREPTARSQRKEMKTDRTKESTSSKSQRQQALDVKTASATSKDKKVVVDKTCLNGDWALTNERKAKTLPESNKGSLTEIDALKNKVLAKASAKVIKRKDFAPLSENKSYLSQGNAFPSNSDNSANCQSKNVKESTVKKENDKNKHNNDISYSLSFLESLHAQESEVQISNLPKHSSKKDDQAKINLPDESGGEANRTQDGMFTNSGDYNMKNVKASKNANLKGIESHRWATERDTVSSNAKHQQPHSRTQRRNSVGGAYQHDADEKSKAIPKNRLSQPVTETDSHFGRNGDSPENCPSNFPLLFGSTHKTLDVQSHPTERNAHVTLFDKMEGDNTASDKIPSSTKNVKSMPVTDGSIIICDEEVQSWLENLGLQEVDHYVSLFSENEMDMSAVRLLTASHLREMGIHALGPIMKIMKGVQVLNRNSTLREETINDQIQGSEDGTFNDVEGSTHDEKKEEGRETSGKSSIQSNNKVKETTQSKKSPVTCPSSLSWKETSDKAEFINLNDRSPVDDVKIPQPVTVKEKSKRVDKERKSTAPAPKSGQRKMKSATKSGGHNHPEIQSNSKVVRKPPVKDRDGISSAHEKYLERKKQEDKIGSDSITSARQRQLRDKMAARHMNRRSSSLERQVSTNGSQKMSLNKTLSETESQLEEIFPMSESPKGIEELLNTKSLKVHEEFGENLPNDKKVQGLSVREGDEASIMKFLDTKNVDPVVEKLIETEESLNLSIVRQLKKQLHNIEQHLVQKMEQPVGEIITEKPSEENEQERMNTKNDNRDDNNIRPSARERRRQRTPKQFSSTLEGKNNISQDFLKVGGILSNRVPNDDVCVSMDKKFASPVTAQTDCPEGDSPHTINRSPKDPGNPEIKDNVSFHQATSMSTRKGPKEPSPHTEKPIPNTETYILDADNIHSKIISRQTELSRGKLVMAQEYLRKMEIDRKDISFNTEDLLGDGTFSQVYKGIYQGSEVAIKQLKTALTANDKNYFSAEVSLLQELRHPHVVMLLGVCTAYTCPVLVLEYLHGGNLHTRIHDNHLPAFSKKDFCRIAHDISSGLCYLHQHRPPVLHLDLKSRNILLGFDSRAKVADFGFSKWKVESDIRVSRSSKSNLSQGSTAWMAPELLAAGDITPKADVYSFAIVIWEMLVREDPYKGCSTFQILERVRNCQRPVIPACPQELKTLLERCWEQNPCTRPTFKEILQDLDKVSSNDEWLTPLLEICSAEESAETEVSQKSLGKPEATVSIKNGLNGSPSPRNVTKTLVSGGQDFPILANQGGAVEDEDEKRMILESRKEEIIVARDSVEDIDSSLQPFNDINTSIALGDAEKTLNVDQAGKLTESPSLSTSSPQSSFIQASPKKVKQSVYIPTAAEIETEQNELNNQATITPRQSVSTPNISPPVIKQEPEKPTTTQILLDSARGTKKLNELLNKYLPSPSPRSLDRVRQSRPASRFGEASRKLLPLRQSLDKPDKPPKPVNAIRSSSLSQSENFGSSATSAPPLPLYDKRLEDIKDFQLETDSILSDSFEQDVSEKSARNKKSFQILSPKVNNTNSDRSPVPQIPSLSEGQQNVYHDNSSPSGKSQRPSHSPDDLQKTSHFTSSSKNFSDVTKEIEQTLSSLHNISTQPPLEENIEEVISVLQANDHRLNSSVMFEKEFKQSDSFGNEAHPSPYVTKLNLDECRSSVNTNMSVDSLSLSLSDEADSIDFSKPLSLKEGKANYSQGGTHSSTMKNVVFGSAAKMNPDSYADTKRLGNVRESFFLFDDFHLDLKKSSDSDSETERKSHINSVPKLVKNKKIKPGDRPSKESKSQPPILSQTVKPHKGKQHFHLPNHQSHHKEQIKKEEFETQAAHRMKPFDRKMDLTLKEGICNVKQRKEASSNQVPPPPPLLLTSQQIKRGAKEHSHPIMSGCPVKSASTKPEVQGHSRFSVEPGLLLQQKSRLKSVAPEEFTPLKEISYGRQVPSVANILKKAMDDRRLAMGDNQESQEGMTTPDASWSIQD